MSLKKTPSVLWADWKLSITAKTIIESDVFFLNYLITEKDKHPLPPFYTPNEVEIRFDNVLILKIDQGEVVYFNKNKSNLEPCLIDWRFDDDCALFQANNQILINRVSEMESFSNIKQKVEHTRQECE